MKINKEAEYNLLRNMVKSSTDYLKAKGIKLCTNNNPLFLLNRSVLNVGEYYFEKLTTISLEDGVVPYSELIDHLDNYQDDREWIATKYPTLEEFNSYIESITKAGKVYFDGQDWEISYRFINDNFYVIDIESPSLDKKEDILLHKDSIIKYLINIDEEGNEIEGKTETTMMLEGILEGLEFDNDEDSVEYTKLCTIFCIIYILLKEHKKHEEFESIEREVFETEGE